MKSCQGFYILFFYFLCIFLSLFQSRLLNHLPNAAVEMPVIYIVLLLMLLDRCNQKNIVYYQFVLKVKKDEKMKNTIFPFHEPQITIFSSMNDCTPGGLSVFLWSSCSCSIS